MAIECELITGHLGEAHVSSADASRIAENTITNENKFIGDIPSLSMLNANTVNIDAFTCITQGRYSTCQAGTVTIENGESSGFRKDVIMLRYEKDNNDVETTKLFYVKGTPASTETEAQDATTPYVGLRIDEGADIVDFPFFRITLNALLPTPSLIVDSNIAKITDIISRITSLEAHDFVIAEGKSACWYYRKWNSGFAELYLMQYDVWPPAVHSIVMELNIMYPFLLHDLYARIGVIDFASDWANMVNFICDNNKIWSVSFNNHGDYVFHGDTKITISGCITGYWK